VHLFHAPHFAIEGREEEFAGLIMGVLAKHGVLKAGGMMCGRVDH
jgi:hypothetical protein